MSEWINNSDRPFRTEREFMPEVFVWADANRADAKTLNSHHVPEIVLNSSGCWRKKAFPVATSEGIFAHARFDDSFRPGHKAYNAGIIEGGRFPAEDGEDSRRVPAGWCAERR